MRLCDYADSWALLKKHEIKADISDGAAGVEYLAISGSSVTRKEIGKSRYLLAPQAPADLSKSGFYIKEQACRAIG